MFAASCVQNSPHNEQATRRCVLLTSNIEALQRSCWRRWTFILFRASISHSHTVCRCKQTDETKRNETSLALTELSPTAQTQPSVRNATQRAYQRVKRANIRSGKLSWPSGCAAVRSVHLAAAAGAAVAVSKRCYVAQLCGRRRTT